MMSILDKARYVNEIFERVYDGILPMPHSIEPHGLSDKVEFTFMATDSRENTIKVFKHFEGFDWEDHRASTARDPIYAAENYSIKVTLFAHPAAIQHTLSVSE